MNSMETLRQPAEIPKFNLGLEDNDFDINAAFHNAMFGVATDIELALDEKIRRMETIVSEGTSEIYRDFIDFSEMAAQLEMICRHDHDLKESFESSLTLTSFMEKQNEGKEEDEVDTKTGKKTKKDKKKKRKGWLAYFIEE